MVQMVNGVEQQCNVQVCNDDDNDDDDMYFSMPLKSLYLLVSAKNY